MEKKSRRKSSSAERELERRKRRQELYFDTMTDLTALRNHYKAEVRAKLEMKVAKQRKEREEKKNELEKVAQEEMEKKQKLAHTFTVKLPKSSDLKDKGYLQKVPFSKFYLVNDIRNQLEKNNELDKKYKMDEFHKVIYSPEVLRKVEREITKGNIITMQKLKEIAQNINQNKAERSLKSDWENEQNKAAKIHQEQVKPDEVKKEKIKQQKGIDNLEEIFPPIQYPELLAINRNFGSPEPDDIQIDLLSKRKKRMQETERRKRIVERMFRLSRSYQAATNRLMTKYKNLNFQELAESKDPKEIFLQAHNAEDDSFTEDEDGSILEERFPIENRSSNETEVNTNIYKYLDSLNELEIADEMMQSTYQGTNDDTKGCVKSKRDVHKEKDSKKWEGRVYSDEILRKEILGVKEIHREPRRLAPLTMNALEETTKVKTLKGQALWINPEQ